MRNLIQLTDSTNSLFYSINNDSVIYSGKNIKLLIVNNKIGEQTILGVTPETAKFLIPVIVTICIFVTGIIINVIIKKFDRKVYLSSIKSVLITWGRLLAGPLNQQVESCRRFQNNLVTSTDMQPQSFQYNTILANKLQSISIRDHIDATSINQRGNNQIKSRIIFNIISQSESIDLIEKELRTKYDVYHSQSFEIMDEWNSSFVKFDNLRSNLRQKYHNSIKLPIFPFYQQFTAICNNFVGTNPNGGGVDIYQNQLLDPLIQICQQFALSHPHIQEIYDVSYAIMELIICNKKWTTNREGTAQLFGEFANRLENSYQTLLNELNELERMKFKWIIFIK